MCVLYHTLRALRHAASFVREGSEEIHCNVEYFKEIEIDAPQKGVHDDQIVHDKFSLECLRKSCNEIISSRSQYGRA